MVLRTLLILKGLEKKNEEKKDLSMQVEKGEE